MAREQGRESTISVAEWSVAGIGLLLVLGTVAFLVAGYVRREPAPPVLSFTIDTVMAAPSAFVVRVKARNLGTETAAATRIEAALLDAGGTVVERSEISLQYLPGNSTRSFGLFFSRNPADYRLTIRATGYQHP